jgi:hypothetical protein
MYILLKILHYILTYLKHWLYKSVTVGTKINISHLFINIKKKGKKKKKMYNA